MWHCCSQDYSRSLNLALSIANGEYVSKKRQCVKASPVICLMSFSRVNIRSNEAMLYLYRTGNMETSVRSLVFLYLLVSVR